VSHDYADDAAVVRFANERERALVMTADVIAPIVDEPESFGAIAATNSVSDVYAMGGRPLFALNLVFFPDSDLPRSVLDRIMTGGQEACRRMGVAIIGGHTVRDPEVKYGLSVVGEVRADQVWSNRTAVAGQALVLTKALGTGILGQAIKGRLTTDEQKRAAVESMITSNESGVAVGRRFGVTACTDVTGFGLLGHLRNILRGSDLTATLFMDQLPILPGALEHAREGRIPGGSKANLAFVEPALRRTGEREELVELLAADAQTSGGLLLCAPAENAAALETALRDDGLPARVVGELAAPDEDHPIGTTTLRF